MKLNKLHETEQNRCREGVGTKVAQMWAACPVRDSLPEKTPGELQKAPASCKKHRMMDRRVGAPEFRILIARPIRNANGSATGGRGYLVRMAQAEPLCTTIGAF